MGIFIPPIRPKRRYTIGEFPSVSLKEVRRIRDRLRAQIALGNNPQQQRNNDRVKDVLTVERAYEEFQRRHLKAKLKSWQEIDRAIVKDFSSGRNLG